MDSQATIHSHGTRMILVSPTEPPTIQQLGRMSSLPETYGCDMVWSVPEIGLFGVQRKGFFDLIASLYDGRLQDELPRMANLPHSMLLIEGQPKWTSDGNLLHPYYSFTHQQYRGLLWSVQQRSIWVEHTGEVLETRQVVEWLYKWTQKPEHLSLVGRPSPRGNAWGRVTNRDYAIHLLTSLPGVGPKLAGRIYDRFSRAPLRLDCTDVELLQVEGVGKEKLRRIKDVFGQSDVGGGGC